jgi:APA family basic amino acid/polyamine antiporter
MCYAMARREHLPIFLSRLHRKYNTPYYSIWIIGVIITILVLFVDITRVVAISTFSLLFYYSLANVSALKLKARERVYPKAIPFLGVITCAALLAVTLFASPQAWVIGVSCLAVGAFYYFLNILFKGLV